MGDDPDLLLAVAGDGPPGGFDGEPKGRTFDPPIDLSDSLGVFFDCQYTNTREQTVVWGNGQNEMCELFGFSADAPYFQARVETGSPVGMDGDVQLNYGDCVTQQVSPMN